MAGSFVFPIHAILIFTAGTVTCFRRPTLLTPRTPRSPHQSTCRSPRAPLHESAATCPQAHGPAWGGTAPTPPAPVPKLLREYPAKSRERPRFFPPHRGTLRSAAPP